MKFRTLLALSLAFCVFLAFPRTSHADSPILDEPQLGNLFLCGQHALAAEMRNQPYAALLEGARVLNTKGMCYRDKNWLTSWRLAQSIVTEKQSKCIEYYACSAYFLFETIEPSVREPIALAVHVALTETPSVRRFHFDHADAPLAYFWSSPLACPFGHFVVGSMRFC